MFSYIHIPFCESKCKYCRFASVGKVNKILIKKYLDKLNDDIISFKRPVKNAGLLSSIYFGGGTPSILEEKDLQKIINNLKNKFGFKNHIEITLETTPKNITFKNIKSWENLGINRISIGIQTLNDKTLKEIGRDNKKTILNGLNLFSKNRKIKNISLDFIIGLPYVKKGEILKDIKFFLKNYDFIKHISVYMLEDYYLQNNENGFEKIAYPNNWKLLGIKQKDYLKEYLKIKKYLEKKGFFRYELSNFAKVGYECKHNKSYWNHSENVGFGLGSHSFINNTRYAYKDDFIGYYSGKLEYEELLNKNDIFLEKVLFGFRTFGISKSIYKKLNMQKIKKFINAGLLEIKNENLCITDNGVVLIDKIILEII